jgi:subtilase family serine protease/flagellar hook assembly protein FlgD/Tol biopolymer transport system component/fibronectin type 3 domain-containing protein
MRRTRVASAVRACVVVSAVALFASGAARAQTTPHVAVLHANPALYGANGWSARAEVARSFFASHADAYDFLIVFPAFPLDLSTRDPGEILGLHWGVRNDVAGIGLASFDAGAQFGSPGRLKGVIDIHSLVPGVDTPGADVALTVVAHEVAHQWGSYVAFRDPRTGVRSSALIGRDASHWSYFLDSDASVLYGSDWRDAGGGRFVAEASSKRYSPLDLYLMGILGGSEVPAFALLAPGDGAPSDATALPPAAGTAIAATSTPISVADIVAVEGPRAPAAATSQKAFRAAFAIVTPEGVEPTAEQLALVNQVRREWANQFFFMTRGRAVMETDLAERTPAPVASSPTIGAGVEYLLSRQNPNGSWSDLQGLEARDTELAIEALAGFQANPRIGGAVGSGATYLGTRPLHDADTCARVRLGGSAASALAAVVAPVCPTDTWLDGSGGVGLSAGYHATIVDTALTGLSLLPETDPKILVGLEEWLLAQQNPDGGWAYVPGGPSQVESTALVLRLLASASSFEIVKRAGAAAETFLATRAFPTGGYGDIEADPGMTAAVVLALGAWRVPDPITAREVTQYLLATQQADGSWGSSVADTALAVRALREYLSPNVAAASVAVASASGVDGEVVLAIARVENSGRLPVASVDVQAFDSAGRAFGPPITLQALGAGERRQVTLVLDTSGHGGSTELFVVVDPAGVLEESSKADNRLGVPFVVGGPSEGPDAVVVPGSLVATPPRVERFPSQVTVSATVGNIGLADAAQVLVEARVRGVAAGSVRVDLAARSRVPVAIPVSVGPGSGDVPVEIVVDPLGELAEPRRGNNAAAILIPVVPTIDLRVAGLTLAPADVEQGADLRMAYVLANAGTALAQVAVEVRVADAAGRLVSVQLDPGVAVPPGTSLLRTATWRAMVAGPVTVTVDATHPADRNDADNRTSAAVIVRASPHPNLVVRAADLVAAPDPALEGKRTAISATVRNVGGGAAGPFAIDFWLGSPGSGTRVGRQTSAGLAGGAEWTATVSIQVSDPTDLVVNAVADPDRAVEELDETDNEALVTVPVKALPNLALGSGALVLSTAFPRSGEAVDVDVAVQNTGGQASDATTVELRWRPAGGTEQVVGSAPLATLDGGASRTVRFRWAAATSGNGTLAAVANPGCSGSESTCADNRAERSVLVQNGAVALTNPYLSPNGDGVKDDTEVFWRGDAGADVAIEIGAERGGPPVRRLTANSGSAVWDGKDEAGRVVRDGRYALTVTTGAGALVGRATAVVDTNRSLLHEAPRTMIESELVNALVSEWRGGPFDARILPDDSAVVLNGCGPQLADGNVNCGLHLQRFDGAPPQYLNAAAARFALSPDGTAVAFVADDCSPSTPRAPGCVSLHLVSVPGGEDRRVWEAPTYPGWVDGFFSPVFSPDGRRVAFILGGNLEEGTVTVEAVGVDGSDHRVVAAGADWERLGLGNSWWFSPRELAYSPDGAWVAVSDSFFNLLLSRDGPKENVLLFDGRSQLVSGSMEPDGCDRQVWLGNGHEIAYAVMEGILGFDIATHAVRTIVSPASLGLDLFLNDGKLARDPYSEALIFPDNDEIVGPESEWPRYRVMLASPIGSPPTTLWETPTPQQSWIDHLQWSPSGATVEVGQWGFAETVGWSFNRYLVRSLANLTTRVAAVQSLGTRYITFRGTATDLNFERYEIQTRSLGEGGGTWTVVASRTPVQNGELGTWTPPSPGVYEATLLAFDKAGNARARRVRFTWGDASPIANLRRDPEFISPNGDGVQDQAVVSYTVVAPVTVTARVMADAGEVVRTIQRTHASAEDDAIAWDGLDEGGALVPDGVYWVEAAGSRFRVVVDTKRPRLDFALLDRLSAEGGEEFTARLGSGKAHTSPCVMVQEDISYQVPQVDANATVYVEDENLLGWTLEATGYRTETYTSSAEQGVTGLRMHTPEVRGRTFQVLARDLAGNAAESARESYDERLFLLGIGDERLTDWCVPRHGLLFMGYPYTYENYPGLFAYITPFVKGEPTIWQTAPGSRSMLVFTHTIREPIVSLAVMYRRGGNLTDPYVFDYDVENFLGVAALWNVRDRTGVWEYVLVATDASGRVHYSERAYVGNERPDPGIACLGRDDRAELRFTLKNVDDLRTVATDHGTFEIFQPAGDTAVEVRRDAAELTWIGDATLTFDVSALPSCVYGLRFKGHFTNGDELRATSRIDVCGAFVRDHHASGSLAAVSLGETYRAPLAEVAVYTPDPVSGALSIATRLGPFEGQSPTFTLDLAGRPLCSELTQKLVTHLADGSVIDESNHPEFRSCDRAEPVTLPCTRVSLGHWVRHDAMTACSGEASTMDVFIAGETTRSFASMEAKLVSAAGVPVATLATSGFIAHGKRFDAVAAIPVEALAPGRYLVSVEARDDAGFTANAVTPLDDAILIDRARPVASLSAPRSGAIVCPARVDGPNGSVRWVVDVVGTATDEHLEYASVVVKRPGSNGYAQGAYTPAIRTQTLSGTLDRVAVEPGLPGEWGVRLSARDATGNEACTPETMFHVPGELHLTNLAAAPALFSPDRDGVLDETTVSFELDEAADVRVVALLPDGRTAELARSSAVAGSRSVVWDGTVEPGVALPEGRVPVEVVATGACGASARASADVEVDTLPPVVKVTSPVAGARASADFAVTGSISDAHLQRWTVAMAPVGGATFQGLAEGTEALGGVLATIPVRDLAVGPYVVRVEATDRVGHATHVDVPFEVVPGAILDRFVISPSLASPNGDGRFDTAVATVALKQAASVTLEIVDASGAILATALSSSPLATGVTSVALDSAFTAIPNDGDYVVHVSASAAGATETAVAPLGIDRVAPAVRVSAPTAQACLAGALSVEGSLDDTHLRAWSISLRTPGAQDAPLASGTAPMTGTIAVAAPPAEGPHLLVIHADDLVGNSYDGTIPFVADRTEPELTLANPGDGGWVSGLAAPVEVRAVVADPNLVDWTLSLRDDAGNERTLGSGQAAGFATASWDAKLDPEVATSVVARARDCAGNVVRREARVTVDHTLPTASLTGPRDSSVRSGPLTFVGTADDANLERWTLELAQGPAFAALGWVMVATGVERVLAAPLGELFTLPADGLYTARLTVRDRAGNEREDLATFVVDTKPPGPPLLSGHVRRPSDGVLSWTPSPDADVVGYRVQRAHGTNALALATQLPSTSHAWDDLGLQEGTWSYAVVAVDAAGLESAPSNVVTLAVDATPPRVAITAPGAGAIVSGYLDVVGTAFSPDDFKEYRLSVGAGAGPASFSLLRRSPAPVLNDVLAPLDVVTLAEGSTHTLRLEAEDLSGNVAEARVTFTVDNRALAGPVLVSANALSRDVTLTWELTGEADLAGFVVYRDGLPLGIPPAALADPRAYLIAPGLTTFVDVGVPDGTFTYQIQAFDHAANPSPLSNALSVTIDLRPPTAQVVNPVQLARIPGPLEVTAESEDRDLASVQFEVRAGGQGAFVPFGAPVTASPWTIGCDPGAFPSPVLEFRAVASDSGGRTDPAPQSVLAFFDPPLMEPRLVASTQGRDVAVRWTDANAPERVAGYAVRADGAAALPPAPRPAGTATASADAAGAVGAYDGNASTRWIGASGPQWWQVELASRTVVDGITVSSGYYPATFDLAVRVKGAWVKLARGVQAAMNGSTATMPLTPPLEIEVVRVEFAAGSYPPDLAEVTVSPVPLTTTTSFVHAGAALGAHGYDVVATSPFGRTATAATSATVYQPTLESPAPATATSPAAVHGHGVPEGAEVALSDGSAVVARTTAAKDGTFQFLAPLVPGANTFTAEAVDPRGNRSAASNAVTVTLDPPPSTEVTLSLQGVAGSDVSLAFDVAHIGSDVAGFALSRDSGDGYRVVATIGSATRAVVDRGVRNGTHVYRIAAVNGRGFAGAPSNTVTAVVAVAAPPAPVLAVTAPPEGRALQLGWTTAGTTPSSFVVERETAAGSGTFTLIATGVTTTPYRDAGLTNGVEYRYRVTGIDRAGNAGPPSNVASGVPSDGRAPGEPRITEPTTPGTPIAVADQRATVAGIAEFGSTVELSQNARFAGRTRATRLAVEASPIALAYVATSRIDAPSGAGRIAYLFADAAGDSRIAVQDLWTGQVLEQAVPAGLAVASGPYLAPSGDRVAIVASDPGAGYRWNLWVGDVHGSAMHLADLDPSLGVQGAAWSPDGSRLAYVEWAGGIVVADGDGGGFRACAGRALGEVAWISTNEIGGVEHGATTSLVGCSVATSATRTILSAQDISSWVAGVGAVAANVADASYRQWLDVVDRAGKTHRLGASFDGAPAFSPDGTQVAWFASGSLYVGDVGTGEARSVGYQVSGRVVAWPSPSALLDFAEWGGGDPNRLDVRGRFEVPVTLENGDNFLTAVAIDDAGNRSPSSEPIVVRLEPGQLADLAVAAQVQPSVATPTRSANAMITVRNLGPVASRPADLEASFVVSTGDSRIVATGVPSIPPGGQVTAALAVDTAGLAGSYLLEVSVDPRAVLADADRSNNAVRAHFHVAPEADVVLDVAALPSSIPCGGVTTARVTVVNPAGARDAAVQLSLIDGHGAVVVTEPASSVALRGGEATIVEVPVHVGLALAGDYRLLAALSAGNAVLGSASTPVVVEAETLVGLELASARATYAPDEPIDLAAAIANRSRNSPLSGATIRFDAVDANGVLRSTVPSRAVPFVWVGGEVVIGASIPPGALPAGRYVGHVVVELGGITLAAATAPFVVSAEPILSGSLVASGAGTPPATRAGAPVTVTSMLRNSGTGPALAVTANLVVLAADGSELERIALDLGDLEPNASAGRVVVLATTSLPLGTYDLALVARYDGRAETLATGRFRVADALPPVLLVQAPSDGAFVRSALNTAVAASDDHSGTVAVRVTVDGAPPVPLALTSGIPLNGTWSGALPLGAEGPHLLVFSARDAEGNDGLVVPTASNPIAVRVTVDTTPPSLTVSGVTEQACYAVPPIPRVQATDLNLGSTYVMLDGEAHSSGTPVVADGDHTLVAQATDRAGNQASATVRFVVDRTAPRIGVSGIVDGSFVSTSVAYGVTVDEAHPTALAVMLNGVTGPAAATVTADGVYALAVHAADCAGNTSDAAMAFTIDRIAPVVTISGAVEGSYLRGPATPTWTATDTNLASVAATLNGAPITSGTTVAVDGNYLLEVVATDRAGNSTTRSVAFVIDSAVPMVEISGFVDGSYVGSTIYPSYAVTDANLAHSEATLDAVPFVNGIGVTAEGLHVFTVTAGDRAGNETVRSAHFTIDRTAPRLALTGFTDGAVVTGTVTAGYTVTDDNLASVAALLDGQPFTSGTGVILEGPHVLVVHAVDLAGNESDATGHFAIDNTPPRVAISGVVDGSVTSAAIIPVVVIDDANLASSTITLDGAAFASGTSISAEADHVLAAMASDRAGLTASATVRFAIDRTAPTITISNVVDGGLYASGVAPLVQISELHPSSSSVTLDGAAYVSGTPVLDPGVHVLSATARDVAGNSATAQVVFSVDGMASCPGPEPLGARLPVFQDSMLNCFEAAAVWGGHDLEHHTVVHSGSTSMAFNPSDWAALKLERVGLRSRYRGLEFWVNGGSGGGQPVLLEVTSGRDRVAVNVDVANLLGGPIPAGTWTKVSLSFGIPTPADNLAIWFKGVDGQQEMVYIDDLVLLADTAGTCTGSREQPCSDGDVCNGLERCDGAGACVRGVPLQLDDQNPCTVDMCDSLAGVSHTPAEPGLSCFVEGVCGALGACDGVGQCQPTTTVQDVRIYDDAVAACFEDDTTARSYDPYQSIVVHGGAHAIRFDPGASDQVTYIGSGLGASFDAVEFWIHGGTAGGQAIKVYIDDSSGVLFYGYLAEDVLGHNIAPGTWERVRVPFSRGSQPDWVLLLFQAAEAGGTVYMDDIRLVRNSP